MEKGRNILTVRQSFKKIKKKKRKNNRKRLQNIVTVEFVVVVTAKLTAYPANGFSIDLFGCVSFNLLFDSASSKATYGMRQTGRSQFSKHPQTPFLFTLHPSKT